MTFVPSKYQADLFQWAKSGKGNAVIKAVAGSGKSTSLKLLLNYLPPFASVLYVAFNTEAAKELKNKLEQESDRKEAAGEPVPLWDCRTIHSLGNATLAASGMRGQVKGNKYIALCRQYLRDRLGEVDQSDISALSKLVDMVRLTLSPTNKASLAMLTERFDIEFDEDVWPHIPQGVWAILETGITLAKKGEIDFTDMIWLPSELSLSPKKYDVVLVDEAQDLSPAQRALVLKAVRPNGRFIAVGDPNQAIYGFCGASLQSIQEIINDTRATTLPLSICYRCPKSVIDLANTVRPGTEPAPDAVQGVVQHVADDQIIDMVQPGDLILCRLNAPLVQKCLELLRMGKRATVRGKDLGTTFTALVKKIRKTFTGPDRIFFEQLPELAYEYERQQVEMLDPEEHAMKIVNLQDKIATLLALYDAARENGIRTLEGFLTYTQDFFADDPKAQIILSTGHRAKGLEYDRVFILGSDKLPHPRARTSEQLLQEGNLMYVMYTRAKKELYLGMDRVQKAEQLKIGATAVA